MDKWIRDALSKCLDCIVTDQMLSAIMHIKTDADFDDYFGNLLSEEIEDHRIFLLNCRRMLLSGKQGRIDNNNGKQSNVKVPPLQTSPPTQNQGASKKEKSKYVNLYANDGKMKGDTIMLKGRRMCDCQAAQHQLINNCLGCGRIVCTQEGSGPCLYCSRPVYTPEEEQQMAKSQRTNTKPNQTTAKNAKNKQKKPPANQAQDAQASGLSNEAGLQQAIAQRDRLLEYDRNSEKRTTVIDDEFDYFQENSVWLSDAEREKHERLKNEMQELKHGSRMKRKIKVDFAGRELPEELPISMEQEKQVLRELAASNKASSWSTGKSKMLTGHSAMILSPNLNGSKPPVYKPTKNDKDKAQPAFDGLERNYNRVQDKELLEMQDMRQCLSMHQPWASLLVAGIKKHEGRVWYSEHRGRLWIASTAKEAPAESIAEMEQFYKSLYNDENIVFPKSYPAGSLLGCVNIDNCLPQEEYREQFPQGESDSPYVFVCSRPEQLPLRLPVQGEHKIYELPLKTHNTACKTLLRARLNKS